MRHFSANTKGSTDRLLCEIPKRIAVFGSKPRDLEALQSFHVMDSEVTLIESGPQLLHEADREIAQRLGKLLHDAGTAIKRDVAVEAFRRGDEGTLVVVLAEGKGEVVADKVLAARRLPNSVGLGLRELGVKLALSQVEGMEQGAVLVNERMETSVLHICAVGDVTAGSMWSHKANVEGIIAGENAMGLTARRRPSSDDTGSNPQGFGQSGKRGDFENRFGAVPRVGAGIGGFRGGDHSCQ
jgi:dihydrolipoamide dehydrogenase